MNIKKEYFILVAIILVLSLYIILHKRDKSHYRLPEPPKVMQKEISRIEITSKDAAVVLKKKDNGWEILPQGYSADANKVRNMLDIIEKLILTALVSESKNYERYDLDEDEKLVVKAWAGDTLRREFEIGKAATTFRHTFVKLSDDHRVYHARGNFRNRFDLGVDSLRDKTVLAFDAAEIQEMRFSKEGQSLVFTRKQVPVEINSSQKEKTQSSQAPKEQATWLSTNGKRGDESQLDRILTTLADLRCERYLDDRKKEDLSDPIYTIQLTGVKKYSLSLFAKDDEKSNSYPAISSENEYPFSLPSWQAKDILKDPAELLEKTSEGDG